MWKQHRLQQWLLIKNDFSTKNTEKDFLVKVKTSTPDSIPEERFVLCQKTQFQSTLDIPTSRSTTPTSMTQPSTTVAYSQKISRLKSLRVSVYYYVISATLFKQYSLHNKFWEINL
jgi:hypothetical protein